MWKELFCYIESVVIDKYTKEIKGNISFYYIYYEDNEELNVLEMRKV